MRIVLFGATGRTGRRVAHLARAAGHEIRAVSRSAPPNTSSPGPTEIDWIRADVRDADGVRKALDGADAVISAVGIGTSRQETAVYSAGVHTIAQAMTDTGITRLAVVSAAPVGDGGDLSAPQRTLRSALWWLFGATYRDMSRMEKELARWPDLAWLCLRPPYLRDAPPTGRFVVDPARPVSGSLSTGDLAAALLDSVTGPVPSWKTAYIASTPRQTKGRFT